MRLLVLVLGAVLALSGCGAEFVSDPPRTPRSEPADPPTAPDPTGLIIPAIGLRTTEPLLALGLTDVDCPDEPPCLASPPLDQPQRVGWYAGNDPEFSGDEYQPGEPGPAVLAAHVDGYGPDGRKGHPGAFARLGELRPGAEIIVERELAPPLTFVVDRIGTYPKDEFPTAEVYDPTERPELRLITCGGSFDRASGHYEDNVVVWASLASA